MMNASSSTTLRRCFSSFTQQRLSSLALIALFLLADFPAFANGAFPEARQLLLPKERPDETVIAANYGLLISEDRGKTWEYVCEAPLSSYAALYQLGVHSRLLAVATTGLVYSDDRGCTWQRSAGSLHDTQALDAFVYPEDPLRVLAVAQRSDKSCIAVESADGGATFGPALFELPAPCSLGGVEIALRDPNVIYLSGSTYDGTGATSALWRSEDRGKTWHARPLPSELAPDFIRIISIDPENSSNVLLRATTMTNRDRIAVTTNGGTSFTKVLDIQGMFSAFLRTRAGEFILTANERRLFRSADRGRTFVASAASVSATALAERDGRLYAVTDPAADGALLARSADQGETWEPVMSLGDVRGTRACAAKSCESWCTYYAGMRLWSADICVADGGLDAGTAPANRDGGIVQLSTSQTSSSCAYSRWHERASFGASGALLAALLAVARRRRNARIS